MRVASEDMRGSFKEDKQHGHWIYWYESGVKMNEVEYKDGQRHGQWLSWYENGDKRSEGEFKEGQEKRMLEMVV